jgi:hypothetical protein
MLDEGICVNQDSATATRMFEIASIHRHRDSSEREGARLAPRPAPRATVAAPQPFARCARQASICGSSTWRRARLAAGQ